MKDVEFVAEGDDAAWVIQCGEDGVFVGFTVVVGIDEADDAAFSWAFAEGAKEINSDIDFAGGGCGDTGR
jgi:pyridoxal biosynthesis lyase PdxS